MSMAELDLQQHMVEAAKACSSIAKALFAIQQTLDKMGPAVSKMESVLDKLEPAVTTTDAPAKAPPTGALGTNPGTTAMEGSDLPAPTPTNCSMKGLSHDDVDEQPSVAAIPNTTTSGLLPVTTLVPATESMMLEDTQATTILLDASVFVCPNAKMDAAYELFDKKALQADSDLVASLLLDTGQPIISTATGPCQATNHDLGAELRPRPWPSFVCRHGQEWTRLPLNQAIALLLLNKHPSVEALLGYHNTTFLMSKHMEVAPGDVTVEAFANSMITSIEAVELDMLFSLAAKQFLSAPYEIQRVGYAISYGNSCIVVVILLTCLTEDLSCTQYKCSLIILGRCHVVYCMAHRLESDWYYSLIFISNSLGMRLLHDNHSGAKDKSSDPPPAAPRTGFHQGVDQATTTAASGCPSEPQQVQYINAQQFGLHGVPQSVNVMSAQVSQYAPSTLGMNSMVTISAQMGALRPVSTDVAEIPDDKPRQLISSNGCLKVWLVDRGCVTLLCTEEQEQLYNGDCYIIQYSYAEDGKDYHMFLAWSGQDSVQEDRVATVSLMASMADSVKGRTMVGQVLEGREPELFFLVFKSLIIFKGGRSAAYKNSVLQKGDRTERYQNDGAALFRVQGLRPDCIQAIQVHLATSSLNSSHCYILQDGASFFTWLGSLSSPSDHVLLDRMMDKLCPLKQSLLVREGSETDRFCLYGTSETEFAAEHTSVSSTTYVHSLVNLSLSMPWDPGVGALFAMDRLLVDRKCWRTENKPCNRLASSNGPTNFGELKEKFPLDNGLYAPFDPRLHTCLWMTNVWQQGRGSSLNFRNLVLPFGHIVTLAVPISRIFSENFLQISDHHYLHLKELGEHFNISADNTSSVEIHCSTFVTGMLAQTSFLKESYCWWFINYEKRFKFSSIISVQAFEAVMESMLSCSIPSTCWAIQYPFSPDILAMAALSKHIMQQKRSQVLIWHIFHGCGSMPNVVVSVPISLVERNKKCFVILGRPGPVMFFFVSYLGRILGGASLMSNFWPVQKQHHVPSLDEILPAHLLGLSVFLSFFGCSHKHMHVFWLQLPALSSHIRHWLVQMEIKGADNMLRFSQLLLLQSWSLHLDDVELQKSSYVPLNEVLLLLFFLLILRPKFQEANHEALFSRASDDQMRLECSMVIFLQLFSTKRGLTQDIQEHWVGEEQLLS